MVLTFEMMFMAVKAKERARLNLIRLMDRDHMSSSALARLMPKGDPSVVSRWRRAVYSLSLDSIDEICEVTGWPLEEFLKPLENEPPEPKETKFSPAELHKSAGVVTALVNEQLDKIERPKPKKKPQKKAN